jgi:H+-translocating NAD(P) transhydrogenase subunit alpha
LVLVLLAVMIVCAILGYWVISAVPSLLHTPLMSGMNALSGITVIGSIAIYAIASPGVKSIAGIAIILAMINIVGGFWVTERMLRMFKNEGLQGEKGRGKIG